MIEIKECDFDNKYDGRKKKEYVNIEKKMIYNNKLKNRINYIRWI